MKAIFLIFTIVFSVNVFSKSKVILARECMPTEASCELYKDNKNENRVYHGSIMDKMTIGENEVDSAMISKRDGATIINISLKERSQSRLSDLTKESINKRLLIVVDGTVLSSPFVKEEITGGAFQISFPEGDADFKEKLSWLYSLSDLTKDRKELTKKNEVMKYVIVTSIFFIIALLYAFRPVNKKVVKGSPFAKKSPTIDKHDGQPIRPLDHARSEYDSNYNQVIEEDLKK